MRFDALQKRCLGRRCAPAPCMSHHQHPGVFARGWEHACIHTSLARAVPALHRNHCRLAVGAAARWSLRGCHASCGRSLAGKMLSKKAQVEADRQRAQAETVAAAASAQEARFELARRLTEVRIRIPGSTGLCQSADELGSAFFSLNLMAGASCEIMTEAADRRPALMPSHDPLPPSHVNKYMSAQVEGREPRVPGGGCLRHLTGKRGDAPSYRL